MKSFNSLIKYRKKHPTTGHGDDEGGFFIVPSPLKAAKGAVISVIASNGDGWDHVSVSLPNRCPTWTEMDFIKRMFFKDDEVAFQLHPAKQDHINIHNFCLHLWRPQSSDIKLPPTYMV